MKEYELINIENKKLDKIFHDLYNNNDSDTIQKNIVALLVELGELANETRCFKYWSNKKPSAKEIIMDEYADCFLLVLHFCNMANINLEESFEKIDENNIVNQFKELYKLVSNLKVDLDKELIKNILANLVNLGELLEFSTEDIVNGCLLKINRNKIRFNTEWL